MHVMTTLNNQKASSIVTIISPIDYFIIQIWASAVAGSEDHYVVLADEQLA